VHGFTTGEGYGGCPQGVVGGGDEYLIAIVEQGLHGHDNEFTNAVAEDDVVNFDIGDTLYLAALHHCFAGAKDAFGVTVALGFNQVENYVLNNFVGGFKAEGRGVAYIQFKNSVTFLLKPMSLIEYRAANVVTNAV
jgi:hypothetical protein